MCCLCGKKCDIIVLLNIFVLVRAGLPALTFFILAKRFARGIFESDHKCMIMMPEQHHSRILAPTVIPLEFFVFLYFSLFFFCEKDMPGAFIFL